MPKRICPRHGVHEGKRCPQCPQGGRRTTQHQIRATKRWQRVAKFCRRRDGYRCTYGLHKGETIAGGRCPKTGPSLPVHHVQPVEQFPDLAFEPANCRTVCTAHNNQLDAERRRNEARPERGQGHAGPEPHWRLRQHDAGTGSAPGTSSPADRAVAAADRARGLT
jgi:5-methylcytosine-specific restriction endonuclease McrA